VSPSDFRIARHQGGIAITPHKPTHYKRHLGGLAGAQLSDHQQRFNEGNESAEGTVSRLGHSLCRHQVYAPRYREEWLSKIVQAGVRRRAELVYQQLDGLQGLRRNLRPEFVAESRKHKAAKLLRQIPCIGPIRAARLIALMQTAASGNSGPTAGWALRPTTVRNSALSVDNCNVPRNRSSSVV